MRHLMSYTVAVQADEQEQVVLPEREPSENLVIAGCLAGRLC